MGEYYWISGLSPFCDFFFYDSTNQENKRVTHRPKGVVLHKPGFWEAKQPRQNITD